MTAVEPTVTAVEPTVTAVEPADGKTGTAEFPTASISGDLDSENIQLNLKETDGVRQKKGNKRDRIIQSTNSLLTNQNEVENERKNSVRTSVQSSDDGKSVKKSVDVSAEEVSSKKSSSKAKENRGAAERVDRNDLKLSKSLLNSVEAAKQKVALSFRLPRLH